jgi:hypothetical protein
MQAKTIDLAQFPFFSTFLSVITEEELIRFRYRLQKNQREDAQLWVKVLTDEIEEREAIAREQSVKRCGRI